MRGLIIAVTALALLVSAVPAFCSGMLGVRPGALVQSAHFGADMGTLTPFVGLDYFSVGVTMDDADVDISAGVYVPHVGARFYFNPSRDPGTVSPYMEGSLLFSFASADLGDATIDNMIEEALSFWGLNIAFGAEYFFNERFGVTGMYGIRYLKDSADLEVEESDLWDEVDSELSVTYKATYAGVGLNFRF